MSLKNPPDWVFSLKLFRDSIVIRKVSVATDETWGTTSEETTVDYTKKGQATFVTLEDIRYDVTGLLKEGDLRVFLPIFPDIEVTTKDRIIFSGLSWQIYRVIRHEALGKPALQEVLARRMV